MRIFRIDKDTYTSEDDRVVIRKVLEQHVYYRGSHRKTARRPDVLYDIYVDGQKLHYSEYALKDAKEMAARKIKENDNAKKKQEAGKRVQQDRVGSDSTSTTTFSKGRQPRSNRGYVRESY